MRANAAASQKSIEQSELNAMLIAHARKGRVVVRLKGGDPFIFGRGGEEAEALARARVEFEVVPGVTSAIAGPAFAGVPLTHREHGSFVAFVTGHEDESKGASAVPWDELVAAARHGGTLVILMATARMRATLERIRAAGLPAGNSGGRRPMGDDCGAEDGERDAGDARRRVGARRNRRAGRDRGRRTRRPARASEVGRAHAAVRPHDRSNARARVGVRVRDGAAAARRGGGGISDDRNRAAAQLRGAGSRDQTYRFLRLDNFHQRDRRREFYRAAEVARRDIRALGRASIAAIGPATAARLADYALQVAAVPDEYRAEEIISAIGIRQIRGKRFLIPRAEVAREALPEILRDRGAKEVVVAPAYRTVKPKGAQIARMRELIAAGKIDLVTFTSSSTVTNFCELIGASGKGIRAAAIGPITAATAEERGFEVVVRPREYTIEALTEAIREYFVRVKKKN